MKEFFQRWGYILLLGGMLLCAGLVGYFGDLAWGVLAFVGTFFVDWVRQERQLMTSQPEHLRRLRTDVRRWLEHAGMQEKLPNI